METCEIKIQALKNSSQNKMFWTNLVVWNREFSFWIMEFASELEVYLFKYQNMYF